MINKTVWIFSLVLLIQLSICSWVFSQEGSDENNAVEDPFGEAPTLVDPFGENEDETPPAADPFGEENGSDTVADPFGEESGNSSITQDSFGESSNDYNAFGETQEHNTSQNATEVSLPLEEEGQGTLFGYQTQYDFSGFVGYNVSLRFPYYSTGHNEDEDKISFFSNNAYTELSGSYQIESFKIKGILDLLTRIDFVSVPDTQLDLRELMINYESTYFGFSAGNIIEEWSISDVFQIMNFINPTSFNGIIDENIAAGVIGVSLRTYIDIYTINLVFLPTYTEHIPPDFTNITLVTPASVQNIFVGGFSLESVQLPDEDIVPGQDSEDINDEIALVVNLDNSPPEFSVDNMAVAFKFSFTALNTDFGFYFFHGFSKKILYEEINSMEDPQETEIEPVDHHAGQDDIGALEPATATRILEYKRVFSKVTSFGASAAFNIDMFAFRLETKFTLDKPYLFYNDVFLDKIGTFTDLRLDTLPTLEYTAGFDVEPFYNFRILVEGHQYFPFGSTSYVDPMSIYSNYIFGAISYKFLDDILEVMMSTMYDFTNKYLFLIPNVQADFQNGFIIDLRVFYYNSLEYNPDTLRAEEDENIFNFYDNDVIVFVNLKYEF